MILGVLIIAYSLCIIVASEGVLLGKFGRTARIHGVLLSIIPFHALLLRFQRFVTSATVCFATVSFL